MSFYHAQRIYFLFIALLLCLDSEAHEPQLCAATISELRVMLGDQAVREKLVCGTAEESRIMGALRSTDYRGKVIGVAMVRAYIRNQEEENGRYDQMKLGE